jgi:CspA family cold shock protein
MNKVFSGEVIFFGKKGYGFIKWEDEAVPQKDLFVHFSDINCEGFKLLKKGQLVNFQVGQNFRGEPKAIEVTVI